MARLPIAADGLGHGLGVFAAGQLGSQLQREGDGTAQRLAGGEVAADHHGLCRLDRADQILPAAGVAHGLAAVQQAQFGQYGGGGADGRNLFSLRPPP